MNNQTTKTQKVLSNLLITIISFFVISILRLLFTPLVVILLIQLNKIIDQPLAGVLATSTPMILIALLFIIVQKKYSAQLTTYHIYGIWAAIIIQFGLSFVGLLV